MYARRVERAETHAARVKEVLAACRPGGDPEGFGRELASALDRTIGFDVFCFGAVDPQTLLPTSNLTNWPDPDISRAVWRNEFREPDVNKFRELALSGRIAGRLSQGTHGNLNSSARFRSTMRACALRHELRAVLCVDGECWGRLVLFRDNAGEDFDDADVALVKAIAPHAAAAIRRIAAETVCATEMTAARGIVLIDSDGQCIGTNAEARHWLDELGADRRRKPPQLPDGLSIIAAAALAPAAQSEPSESWAKVRTHAGTWLRLTASAVTSGSERQVAVTIEPAPDGDVAELLLHRYGLTRREREVALLVFEGWSTQEIAAALWISAYTVQDHLKSVFEKVGVRSRRDLISTIFERHQSPLPTKRA